MITAVTLFTRSRSRIHHASREVGWSHNRGHQAITLRPAYCRAKASVGARLPINQAPPVSGLMPMSGTDLFMLYDPAARQRQSSARQLSSPRPPTLRHRAATTALIDNAICIDETNRGTGCDRRGACRAADGHHGSRLPLFMTAAILLRHFVCSAASMGSMAHCWTCVYIP